MATEVDVSEVEHWVEILRYTRAEIAALKLQEAEAKSEIASLMGDSEVGVIGKRQVVSYKWTEVHRLNPKSVRQNYPEVATELETVTRERRMELIDND